MDVGHGMSNVESIGERYGCVGADRGRKRCHRRAVGAFVFYSTATDGEPVLVVAGACAVHADHVSHDSQHYATSDGMWVEAKSPHEFGPLIRELLEELDEPYAVEPIAAVG